MKVSEAIQIQEDFVARKYHIYNYNNEKLKESMRTLTKAYSELWEFMQNKHSNILDEFIDSLEDK